MDYADLHRKMYEKLAQPPVFVLENRAIAERDAAHNDNGQAEGLTVVCEQIWRLLLDRQQFQNVHPGLEKFPGA